MKFLWLNNSSSILGGTLQCTHSMVRAFPDCQHVVFSFGGAFGESVQEYFGDNVQLARGHNVLPVAQQFAPDIIVYQNTSPERIPHTSPHGALSVYYQHSAHNKGPAAQQKCQISLCVSHHLAKTVGMSSDTVLHQPVTTPAPPAKQTKSNLLRIGRICTPHSGKWRLSDWLPYFEELTRFPDPFLYEMVGCPNGLHVEVQQKLGGTVKFHAASVRARSLLHAWDILLYTSSVEESFGRVVREAQCCGCVPIVSRRGGFIEQIDPDCGYLVDRPEEVPTAIESYLSEQEAVVARCTRRGTEEGSLAIWRKKFLERLTRS